MIKKTIKKNRKKSKENNKKSSSKDNLKKKIIIVIPAYNEEKVIAKVLQKVLSEGYDKIIVVNDGSKDKTGEIIKKIKANNNQKIIYLEHIFNRGAGAALKTGLKRALEENRPYIVAIDGDDQHNIKELPKFIDVLEKNKDIDIVIGSRFLTEEAKKKVPFKKKITLKIGVLITLILSRTLLTDAHNGYRVFRKEALKKINITLDGFEHASEIIDEAKKNNLKIKEVPTIIEYSDYAMRKGQRIINGINIVIKMILKKILRIN